MIINTEPVGLPDNVRRVMYAYHHADRLVVKWRNPDIPNKKLAKERDSVISELRHVLALRGPAPNQDWPQFAKPDGFKRPGMSRNLGYCKQNLAAMLTTCETTLPEIPMQKQIHIADAVFDKVIPGWIVVGQLKNPDRSVTQPLVYGRLTIEGNLMFRTWNGLIKRDNVALFRFQDEKELRAAAARRRAEIEGVKMMALNGNLSPSEVILLQHDFNACDRALEVADSKGLAGPAQGRTFGFAADFEANLAASRARVTAKAAYFKRTYCNEDCRFTDAMIARAAGSMLQWQDNIYTAPVDDAMVRVYIYTYIMSYALTLSVWELAIKVHDNSDLPGRFAQNFELDRYTAVFANHPNLGQDDFRLADLTDLRNLSLVSGHCLRRPSVKPGEVVEATARKYYGDFVGGENFDFTNPPATVYISRPIKTMNLPLALAQIYRADQVTPELLSGFRIPSPPSAPADPAGGRGAGYHMYSHCYRLCKDGGLKAFNAITHHAMAEMHRLLVATPYDFLALGRIAALLVGWFGPNDHMLDVTPVNSTLSAEKINAIEQAERRARN